MAGSLMRGWVPVALIIMMPGVLFAAGEATPGLPVDPVPSDPTATIAPFIAAAACIERFWEAVFAWYENVVLSTAKLAGLTGDAVHWMRQEVTKAKEALARLGRDAATTPSQLEAAEEALADARSRLEDSLKSSEYVSLKKAITVLGSFGLGVVIAVPAELAFFKAVGAPLPPLFDHVLTGLVIGAGTGPVHTLFNTLVELRNTAAGLADLTRGTALARLGTPPVARAPARSGAAAQSEEHGAPTDVAPTRVSNSSRDARARDRLLAPRRSV